MHFGKGGPARGVLLHATGEPRARETIMNSHIATVGDLIDALDEHDPDTPIRWAAQPAWPFEYTVGTVTAGPDDAEEPVVWLVEGEQVGYLSADVADALGWSA